MKKIIIGSVLTLLTTTVFAEDTINTHTKTWKSIPITVDPNTQTYTTTQGFLMPEGDYYYTYSGYRCLKDKTEISGVNAVELKPQDNKGTVIYCYPEK